MDKDKYYYAVQKLREYEKRKEKEGGNYCTDMGIQKWGAIVDELSGIPSNPKIKIDPVKKLTQREWNDIIRKKVKGLERKIKRGEAGWVEIFLYDVWTKKNKEDWRLPI